MRTGGRRGSNVGMDEHVVPPRSVPEPSARDPRLHAVTVRVGRAAAAGLLVLAAWLVAGPVTVALVPCDLDGWGCLGQAIVILAVVGLVALAAAWPVLWRLGVRPAWPVYLLGSACLPLLILSTLELPGGLPITGALIAVPLSYAVAALITTPGLHTRVRLAVITAVLALYPLSRLSDGM
jgi:hypothetical protein